jgi:hypothetical protein
MRIRLWIGCLAFVAAIATMAAPSFASDSWFVAGRLEAVDSDERRIQVNGRMLHVGSNAKVKLAGGEAGTWDDVVDREDEYVSALVRPGYRGEDEVLTILLEDEIEDGE